MSSESRIWEIRPFGSMRGGRESVIGLVPLNPTSPPTLPSQTCSLGEIIPFVPAKPFCRVSDFVFFFPRKVLL